MTKIGNINLSINLIDKGSHSAFLFIHGLQSRKETFDIYLNNFPPKTKRSLISLDLIGFGQSDKPENFGYDLLDQVNKIKKLLYELEIKDLIIIGHSYGGMIGTKLLQSADLEIKSIINLEGNLVEEDCGESINVANMTFSKFQDYFESLKGELVNSDYKSDIFRGESLAKIPAEVFYKTSKTIVNWSKSGDLYNLFCNSPIPKLLITGSNSSYFSKPKRGNIKHVTIDDVTHFMLSEKPFEVYEYIEKYLTNNHLL